MVQDRFQHSGYGFFVQAVHGFRMPLFFLLSGFFTAMLWRRRGLGCLIGRRARRILIPLLPGCVTIVPLMWGVAAWVGSGTATYGAKSTEKELAESTEKDVWTAAAHGNIDAVARFVETGIELDQEDPTYGQTPLAWAVITGQPETVAYLLAAGADPKARFRDQNTALHSAAFFGRAQCAELLPDAGAGIEARNTHGESPQESMRHSQGTTQLIAGLLKLLIDFDQVLPDVSASRRCFRSRTCCSTMRSSLAWSGIGRCRPS